MKQRLGSIIMILSLVLLFTSAQVLGADEKPLVPDFTLLNKEGESVSLSDYQGKIVILNFWASWCPPCRLEMPEFQELHNELEASEEAVLLLLNQIGSNGETTTTGTDFLKKNNYTMLNLFDYGMVGAGIFGVPGLPTTVVIDQEGYLSSYVVGATTKATVEKMIEGAK